MKVVKIETRKVQITGGGSFIITLPKEWAKDMRLEKGSSLNLLTQPDGNLLITSGKLVKTSEKKKEFDIDLHNDAKLLFRQLIGAYIMGFSTFIIRSKKKIGQAFRESVINFTKSTIGPEIMEEAMATIKIKDLLNPAEIPLVNTINRIYLITKTMHEDAIRALINKDISLLEDIIDRYSEEDRLNWMIARHSNMLMTDMMLSKQMKINQTAANYFANISKFIERIADHAVRIADNIKIIVESKMNDETIKLIEKANKIALEILDNSLENTKRKSMENANNNIESITKLIEACNEINKIAFQMKGKESVAISYIAESIRRTGEYSIDISELNINFLIGKVR
ncbi:MAG: PhoU domain-containing protein [Candidatus Helarchaeota archaeon]